jgi:hypothetical protein
MSFLNAWNHPIVCQVLAEEHWQCWVVSSVVKAITIGRSRAITGLVNSRRRRKMSRAATSQLLLSFVIKIDLSNKSRRFILIQPSMSVTKCLWTLSVSL